MNIGKAIAIFKQIDSDKYTDIEKGVAIAKVLDMEFDNCIFKRDMHKVIEWLWNRCFKWEEGSEE